MTATDRAQPKLIEALQNPAVYEHSVDRIQLIETHISWVILTGEYAYKIKKPVNFGFLDFSTLARRKFCCEEEVRLNRRLAADVYLDVVPLTGDASHPVPGGEGEALEYAVRMRQFSQQAQLDNMLAAGTLEPRHLDAVAEMAARFHASAERAEAGSEYGDPDRVFQPVEENFRQIREQDIGAAFDRQLAELEEWSRAEFARIAHALHQRKRDGFIRECHGDIHLRNLAWYRDAPIAFDCIEFNPSLRWIDTISDLAFLIMDLQDRNRPAWAQRLLNVYLEHSGDFGGLAVLPFYLAYRALVRAKVDALRAGQEGITAQEKEKALEEFRGYLDLASGYCDSGPRGLILMRGLSASGKSTVAAGLAEYPGMIRVRSDVERKRIFADAETAAQSSAQSPGSTINAGIYSAEATRKTYQRLAALAETIVDAGYTAILDATFLEYDRRQAFRKMAVKKKLPYVILECSAPPDTLRRRISERKRDVSDADRDVLEYQLEHVQPLADDESEHALVIDTTANVDFDALMRQLESIGLRSG